METAQREALRAWVESTLSATAILASRPQNGEPLAPRPPRPYALLRFSAPQGKGRPVSKPRVVGAIDDDVHDVFQVYEYTLTVSMFARTDQDASDMLRALRMAPATLDGQLAQQAAQVSILRTVEEFDGAELDGPEWAGRSSIAWRVGTTVTTEDDRGIIESASFSINMHDPDRTITVEVSDD